MTKVINLAQYRLERELVKDLETAGDRIGNWLANLDHRYCNHEHLSLNADGWRCALCNMPFKIGAVPHPGSGWCRRPYIAPTSKA